MTYIENVFVCIAAPLLVAMFSVGKKHFRIFLFFIGGMGMCLLSAYLNTFFAQYYNADLLNATTQIAPVVEEIMKLLPILFYLLVFEPKTKDIFVAVLFVAAGFATFENTCYLIQNGATELSFLLIRGFGTGAMHIVCGTIVGYGMVYVWQHSWLKFAGTFGLLCAAITFHAVYNMLIAYNSSTQIVAFALPILTLIIGRILGKLLKPLPEQQK